MPRYLRDMLALLVCFPSMAAAAPDFARDVLPVFEQKCIRCHGERQKGGKLDMRTPEAMLRGGNSGAAFTPGDAKQSLFIELIEFKEMPPKKSNLPRVSEKELQTLREWVNAQKKK